jgi:hypothetical protein
MKQKNTNYLQTKTLNQPVKGDAVSSYIRKMESMKPQVEKNILEQNRLNKYDDEYSKWESGIRSGGKSLNPSQANTTTSISDSYNRMGFGKIGGLGGRMGELEKASLRLGEAAAGRKLKEQKAEYGYQSRLQSQRAQQDRKLANMNSRG